MVPVSKNWSTDPFVATIINDKVFGRGTCDMKGFIACSLAYAPIFANSNLDRDLHFSFTFDEETACQGAPLLISELKKTRWPSRSEATRLTLLVLAIAGAIGIILGIIDMGFSRLFEIISEG